jgi:hypothetical protein
MKYRVPVHVSMDLEVEVSGRKNPEPAELREAAQAMVEKKIQAMLASGSKFTGGGRATASPMKAKNEHGQPVFSVKQSAKPRIMAGEVHTGTNEAALMATPRE